MAVGRTASGVLMLALTMLNRCPRQRGVHSTIPEQSGDLGQARKPPKGKSVSRDSEWRSLTGTRCSMFPDLALAPKLRFLR